MNEVRVFWNFRSKIIDSDKSVYVNFGVYIFLFFPVNQMSVRWKNGYGRKRIRSGPARGQIVNVYRKPKRRRIMINPNYRTGGYLGLERKFADFESDGDAFATSWAMMEDGTILSVAGVAQGNGESNRIGRKMSIHSIHIRARLTSLKQEAATDPVPASYVGRFCLVMDTQTNGAQLTATDVFDNGQTDDILSFRDLQNSTRFRVLWDRKFSISTQQMAQGGIDLFAHGALSGPIMTYNRQFKKPINVLYSNTTNVIASVVDNSLHIIGIANSTNILLSYQCRIRFTG